LIPFVIFRKSWHDAVSPPISASACAAYPGLLPVIVDGITKAFNARNLDVADDARTVFGVRLHR
jgi:hypothetical protein